MINKLEIMKDIDYIRDNPYVDPKNKLWYLIGMESVLIKYHEFDVIEYLEQAKAEVEEHV